MDSLEENGIDYDEENGDGKKKFPQDKNPTFDEVAAQVLAGEVSLVGYTFQDLISRSLHQLARDGNDEVLVMAIDRLGDQAYKRINQLDDEKLSPLHYAARYGYPNTVRTLLQKMAEVNIKGQDMLTPLHFAARYRYSMLSSKRKRDRSAISSEERTPVNDDPEEYDKLISIEGEDNNVPFSFDDIESVVKVLVDNGAFINARDIYGLTPLHYAAMRGNDVVARDLLSYSDVIDIEALDKQQMSPLFISAMYGYVDICRKLITAGANIMTFDELNQTPLHRAAAEGHIEIVRLLLEAAESGEKEAVSIKALLSAKDHERHTALHVAVSNGHLEISKLLIENGADVNSVRDTLATPLHAAAVVGNLDLIDLLLETGANLDFADINQQTALHKAAANNQKDVVYALLRRNAYINKRDKDAFTPLLMACSLGHSLVLEALLVKEANVEVVDKEDKSALFWCAEQGHLDALNVLLKDERCQKLVDVSDRYDNSPLHAASKEGYVEVVKALLDAGSLIDNKNEDAETALHIAAEEGKVEVVRELVRRYRYLVNDENEDANTPLHLASLNGNRKVVQILLEAGADVEARNTTLWTPLDCASANSHTDVCCLLLDYDSPIDPIDKTKTTPLQLAAKEGHVDVIKLLLKRGASVSSCDASGRNALELAVNNSKRNAALAIVQSPEWTAALNNVRQDPKNPERKLTPFRMLIRKFPDVAESVLDRCTTTNGLDPEEMDFGIKLNFEFVDDTYIIPDYILEQMETSNKKENTDSSFDEEGRLYDYAESYTDSTHILMYNHPLSLMVKYKRSSLLSHPVVYSLVKHKWKSYVSYIYYFNLVLYSIFLASLTGYIILSADWKFAEYELEKRNSSSLSFTDINTEKCLEIQKALGWTKPEFLVIAKWIIIGIGILGLLREFFQFYQARLNYLGMENLLEWVCYTSAFIFVWDWKHSSECFIREVWQWQVGAISIWVAWINLVLFIRKLPFFGIYVVMFTDVLRTFSRFFIVFSLFIVAFALSFFMLWRTRISFNYVGKSLLKTFVMMIGEFEFDSIFNNEDSTLLYPIISTIVFVIFLVLMSIIIMNLLVGLAVDDIKEVQDQATLKRLAMQAQLVMEIEVIIPEALRRYFAVPYKIVRPNKKRSRVGNMIREYTGHTSFDYSSFEVERGTRENMERNISSLHSQLEDLKSNFHRLNVMMSTLIAISKKEND